MHNANTTHIVKALRAATQQLHSQLDSNLPLAQDDPSLADYGQHLLGLALWLQQIDRLVQRAPDHAVGVMHTDTSALDLLQQDLSLLDLHGQWQSQQTDDSLISSWPLVNLPFVIGMQYVIKGSALGTAFLYPRLRQQFPQAPFFYMQDTVAHGKARWQVFLASLEQQEWSSTATEHAIAGAVWAFEQFINITSQLNMGQREIA